MPSPINEIVERQVRNWHVDQQRRPVEAYSVARPTVAISREYGAGGRVVGRQLADLLGFSFFDKELVDQIAAETNVAATVVQSVDEQRRTGIQLFLSELIREKSLSPGRYMTEMMRLVASIAAHGNAVVIGRGAALFLDPVTTVRVRLIAPLELRVRRVAETEHLSLEQAGQRVPEVDAERQLFVRRVLHGDATDPLQHELTINTGLASYEHTVQVIAAMVRARFPHLARAL
jgi:cytidylate kinase